MEKDKYTSLSDSYIQLEGDEKDVIQVTDDILNGKEMMVFSTKSSPKDSVKVTKKNLKKYLK